MPQIQVQIADLIKHSSSFGIERLSFYDPFSKLHSAREVIRLYVESACPDVPMVFDGDDNSPTQSTVRVSILGQMHGKEAIVRACKEVTSLNYI